MNIKTKLKLRIPKLSHDKNTYIRVLIGGLIVVTLFIIAWGLVRHHDTQLEKNPAQEEMVDEGGLQNEDELNDYKYDVKVEVTAQGFSPQTLRIPVDTRINWENKDSQDHRLAISPGVVVPEQFEADHLIIAGGGYPFVIHKAGTFHYYDATNPTLTGTVIVSAE